MTRCPTMLGGDGGIAAALRAVDCRAGEATSVAFGRLFGDHGALLPALTILLTLYVALFAIGLLTGRSRLGLSTLTPRMMTLGLVLTFATSWAAYQNTVYTLATRAPDQLATIVAGTRGSAVAAFADRLDGVFGAVADAAQAAAKPAAPTETGITPATPMVGGFTASTALWLSALLLLIGTVGVLVTAKIALAALLALGPVFVVMALFRGTRGLFEGWLKGVVLLAATPLFAVLIGGAAVAALDPVARAIAMEGGQPSPRMVALLFMGAVVHAALMGMAVRTAAVLVAGWQVPGSEPRAGRWGGAAMPAAAPPAPIVAGPSPHVARTDERIRAMTAMLPAADTAVVRSTERARATGAQIIPIEAAIARRSATRGRASGIGARFRTPASSGTRGGLS